MSSRFIDGGDGVIMMCGAVLLHVTTTAPNHRGWIAEADAAQAAGDGSTVVFAQGNGVTKTQRR